MIVMEHLQQKNSSHWTVSRRMNHAEEKLSMLQTLLITTKPTAGNFPIDIEHCLKESSPCFAIMGFVLVLR